VALVAIIVIVLLVLLPAVALIWRFKKDDETVGGGSFGLGYARKREWLICAGCKRSAIFDVRRGTRN